MTDAERFEPARTDASPASLPEPVTGLPAPAAMPTMWQQMGGISGMLDSGLPVVVFIIANSIGGLTAGIVAAVATAVLIFVLRLARRQPVSQAVGGLLAVGVAAYIAYRSGSAGGFFLLGIYSYLLYGGAMLLSILVRWPAIGLIWEGLNGRGTGWRRNRSLVRRYDVATGVWVVIFAVRYFVQSALLDQEAIGWLAVARIAMGYPLWLAGIAISAWIVLRGTGATRPSLRSMLGGRSQG